MADLQRIADNKIQAAITTLADELPAKITAIKHKHAALGMGGNFLWEMTGACKDAVNSTRDVIEDCYEWVINESFFLTQTRANALIATARAMLRPIVERGTHLITQECQAMHAQNATAELVAALTTRHQQAVHDLDLSLRVTYETRRRAGVRSLLQAPWSLIVKLFKG